jgi:ubiquinone/menaquinone biosynthesis C-methylase UbiE
VPGEVVLDIACGTGTTLMEIGKRVGPAGRAIGVELSPDMARIAQHKIEGSGLRTELVVCRAEALELDVRADAMLFCYTHDVLQSGAALANLMRFAKPECRIVVAGMMFQPWLMGWPLNLFTALRARHYLTTFHGLRDPCAKLRGFGVSMRHLRYFHLGTSYLARGRLRAAPAETGRAPR